MHRRDRVIALGCALAALCGCGTVEEPVIAPGWDAVRADHPLSRAECVQLALDFAPTAAQWRARLDAAGARLDQASRSANPTLGAEWEDFGLSRNAVTALQTTFPLGIALADVFSRARRQSVANHELAAVVADLLTERRTLALSVCTTYDELVAARQALALATELTGIADRAQSAAARRVEVGLDAPVVLARAETEAAELRAQLVLEDDEVRSKEMAFSFALGFRRPVALRLADELLPIPATDETDFEILLADAARTRPELAAASARYAAALDEARLTASPVRFLPRIAGGPRTNGGHLFGIASLEVELPIFDRGEAERAANSAALLVAAAELRLAAHEVTREVLTAAALATDARRFLHDHALPLAERRRDLRSRSEQLFAAGEIDFDALLAAMRDEVRARREALRARAAVGTLAWPLAIDEWLAGIGAVPDPEGSPGH